MSHESAPCTRESPTAILENSAWLAPETCALICGDATVSYGDLNRSTTHLALWLLQNGLRTGDRVAIHWENSIEIAELYFACFKAGLIAVPVNIRMKPGEVEYVLRHADVSICFSQPRLAPVTREAIAIGNLAITLHSELPRHETTSGILPEIDSSDPCAILYTSGTTARPKGVTHTHASLFHSTRLMLRIIEDSGPVTMTTTQMSHMSGLACILLPSIWEGKTLVILPAFEPALALDTIERYKVTYTGGLPFMLALLVDEQTRRPRRVDSVRKFISAGDTVPVALQECFETLFGIPVMEIFGLTESCPVAWNTPRDRRLGSVGKPGIEARIDGNYGSGGAGELTVRSPANFREYWRDPEATSLAVRNGWVHTGDVVRQDDGGYVWFVGRLKQIIVRGGSNISPQEVEEALYKHPSVLQAGVIGIPDPLVGQTVAAYVSLRETATASAQELEDFVRQRLADYKVPERIWFLPALPLGLTGKIDRRALAEIPRREMAAGAE